MARSIHGAWVLQRATLLQSLAELRLVLVAIDDCQWLDGASARALAFAFRRLTGTQCLAPSCTKALSTARHLSALEQMLDAETLERIPVGSLSVGAMHQSSVYRLDRSFAHQTVIRIHERSGGNPFFALEIARLLDAEVNPLEPLPVPETLEELLGARISGLPGADPQALAIAAALGTTSEKFLLRAGIASDASNRRLLRRSSSRSTGRFGSPIRCCPRSSTAIWASRWQTFTHGRRYREDPLRRGPPPGAVDGGAGRRDRDVARRAGGAGGRARARGGRGGARRACVPADPAEAPRNAIAERSHAARAHQVGR